MRVLFQLLDAGVGGGQLVASRVGAALAERGDELGLVVPALGPATVRFAELGGELHVLDSGSLRRPAASRKLAQIARHYDLLYSHTSLPGVAIAAAAAHLARRPHVVHQHTYPYFSPSRAARAAQRAIFPRVTRRSEFVAVAEHVRNGLVEAGIAPGRIQVIPNGVPLPRVRPVAAEREPVVVGMLARLDPGKNIDVFLNAARIARPERAVRYVIGGTPSPFNEYEQQIRAQAANADITVIDPTDADAFLAGLDVVALPSSYEGSPLVLLEAMALGRAVIASDIPGITEVVQPTGAGLLVGVKDSAALASAIVRLVDSHAERALFGERAARAIADGYRLETMLEHTLVVIDRALAEHASKDRG